MTAPLPSEPVRCTECGASSEHWQTKLWSDLKAELEQPTSNPPGDPLIESMASLHAPAAAAMAMSKRYDAEIDRLTARCAELERDAARYRWLCHHPREVLGIHVTEADLTATIDAALAAGGGK